MSLTSVLLFVQLALHAFANSSEILANYPDFVKKITNFDKTIAPLADSPDGLIVALQLLDASSKLPTGILAGNFYDLGNYDECLAIEYDGQYGKYCLGTLALPLTDSFDFFPIPPSDIQRSKQIQQLQPRLIALGVEYTGFHFAACVLSNTSAADIGLIQRYEEYLCSSKATEEELSDGAIGTIVLLAFFWAIICASTVYDIVLYYREQETAHEVLLAFSVLTNGSKIFKSTTNPDQLLCLNGIRAFSMMWVIIGHEYSLAMFAPLVNFIEALTLQQDSANMFLYGATVSVDTFLAIGGLVTVYTFMRTMRKGQKFNILLYYLHRFLRLTPAFAIVILVNLFLVKYMGNGPLWKSVEASLAEPCEKKWWAVLFYFDNYFQDEQMCVPQSWYLAVDMQLFVLSPIVLLLLPKRPKIGLALLGCLAVAGCIVPFCVDYFYDLGATIFGPDYMLMYYIQPYTRFGPYVIGMIAGYFIFKIKFDGLKFKLNKVEVICLWLVFLTGLVSCVYAGHPLFVATEPDRWGDALYTAFNRPAWAVVVCGIILLCVTGHGGPIDAFLSLPVFQFLSKLSYSMYLVHYSLIIMRNSSFKTSTNFSHLNMMHAYCGDFMWTIVFSFLLCVSFESPIIILEKFIFGGFREPQKKNPQRTKEVV